MLDLMRFFGFDRAISYSILLRSWQAVAGLTGIVLIARSFPPEIQGFYYTFSSLVALQSFVELGLYLVISNTASHEWAKLKLDEDGHIRGDATALSRLISLGRFVFKWYAGAALLFLLLAGGGGYWFLGLSSASQVNWQTPWLIHVAFSAVLLWCMPFLSLLEGCDQVAPVAGFRFWQSFVSNLLFWAAIGVGSGLWAAPVLSMVSALLCLFYLVVSKRAFFQPFLMPAISETMNWRVEIFPMQWRLALQGIMNYFVFSLFTPVMFHYYGPIVAGQMGMTQQIVMALLSIAMLWVTTKAPKFGILVAKREFHALNIEWNKAASFSVALMLIGVMILYVTILVLNAYHWEPINRLLSPFAFLLLGAGAVFVAAVQCIAIYLRAHKRELLTATGTITGALMALMVWTFGVRYGPVGAAGSYLIVMAGVALPMAAIIWKRARHDWHK